MNDQLNKILDRAMEWAKQNRSDSSQAHKAAFANSVAYLVTGWSGGFGGPSVREHAVTRAVMLQGRGKEGPKFDSNFGVLQTYQPDPEFFRPGKWTFESAVKFAEPICFGLITELHRSCWKSEHCFDDDPQDIVELNK